MPRQISTLSLADARAIISAGEKKAGELGVVVEAAVAGFASH